MTPNDTQQSDIPLYFNLIHVHCPLWFLFVVFAKSALSPTLKRDSQVNCYQILNKQSDIVKIRKYISLMNSSGISLKVGVFFLALKDSN